MANKSCAIPNQIAPNTRVKPTNDLTARLLRLEAKTESAATAMRAKMMEIGRAIPFTMIAFNIKNAPTPINMADIEAR